MGSLLTYDEVICDNAPIDLSELNIRDFDVPVVIKDLRRSDQQHRY